MLPNKLYRLGLSMSNGGAVLVGVAVAAVTYLLLRVADDWLNERPDVPPQSKAAMAVALSLLFWYGVYSTRSYLKTLRGCGKMTIGLVPPLLVALLALIVWQATEG